MLHHHTLSKKLTTVSALALSAVLLGSLFITPSWGMDDEQENINLTKKKSNSVILIDSQEKFQELLKPQTFSTISSLQIWIRDQFTAEDLKNILNIHSNLSSLHLIRWNMKKEDSVSFFKNLETNKTLKYLELIGCNVGKKGGIAIGEMLKINSTLKELAVEEGNIGIEGGIVIGKSLETNTTLEFLNLGGSCIGEEGGVAIGNSLGKNQTLKKLYLGGNPIGEESGVAIGKGLKANSTLEELNVSGCEIGEKGAVILGEALGDNPTLKVLYLGGTIGKLGGLAIANGFKNNKTLEVLGLLYTDISNESAEIISDTLKTNSTLKVLDLGRLEDASIISICNNLETNNFLEDLTLEVIEVSANSAKAMSNMIKVNSALKKLRFDDIPDKFIPDICNGLEHNATLNVLDLHNCTVGTEGKTTLEKFLEKNLSFRIWEGDFVDCVLEDGSLSKIISEAKEKKLTFIIMPHKSYNLSIAFNTDLDNMENNFEDDENNFIWKNDLGEEGDSSEGVGDFFDEQEEDNSSVSIEGFFEEEEN